MKVANLISTITLICFSANLLAGCTSMQPVMRGESPEQIAEKIKPGEKLLIVDRDFQQHTIVVDSITTNGIFGSGQAFKYDDIELIYKREVSGNKASKATTVTIAGIIILVGGIVLILVAGLIGAA